MMIKRPCQSILGEYTAGCRAMWMVERLKATLDKTDVERALDRMDRRRILRLVD